MSNENHQSEPIHCNILLKKENKVIFFLTIILRSFVQIYTSNFKHVDLMRFDSVHC